MTRRYLLILLAISLIAPSLSAAGGFFDQRRTGKHECGTPLLVPVNPNRWRPARPVLSGGTLSRIKTHVRVHYTTSGSDATTAAFAESVAVYAETTWARATALGWTEPPPDQAVGGDNLYDIYCRATVNIVDSAYGVCWTDSAYTTPYIDGFSSWVEVSKDSIPQPFAFYPRLRALVAHELHHGFQFRCSAREGSWFYENTSVFMEDEIYDDVNTLYYRQNAYVFNPLEWPDLPISEPDSGYPYPGALWAHFLDEYYGSDAVRRVWERCGINYGDLLLSDIDMTLATYYNSTLAKAMNHYNIWRGTCGGYDDGRHFEEGSHYINSYKMRSHGSYPAGGNEGNCPPSGPGGCAYILMGYFGDSRVRIFFDGQDGYIWSAYVLAYDSTETHMYYEFKLPLESGADTGSITIPGWSFDWLLFIPMVTGVSGSCLTFSYTADRVTLEGEVDEGAVDEPELTIQPAANPVRAPVRIAYTLPGAAEKSVMSIYDIAGKLVGSFVLKGGFREGRVVWNGLNAEGRSVPSGVYLIKIEAGGRKVTEKIILIR